MIWPTNLVTCALFNTLHSQHYSGMGTRGGISRERFFTYVFLGSFCWYFFPGYIFQALSFFNWVAFDLIWSLNSWTSFDLVYGAGYITLW